MDPRRKALSLVGVFVGLLGFHLWLLQRMVAVGNVLVSGLLIVAISLFAWRIVHYGNRFRGGPGPRVVEDPAEELRRIRIYAPVLAALLVLHAWLIALMWAAGEFLFVLVLAGAVAVFVIRLSFYARRWAALRRGPSARK